MSTTRANRRGMFALAGAMATFSINDMLTKLTAQRYPLGEVITVRGLIATLLVGGCLIGMGHLTHLRAAVRPLVLTRTAFDGAAMVLFTTALIHMPLAEHRRQSRLAADDHRARGDLLRRGSRLAALDRDLHRLHRLMFIVKPSPIASAWGCSGSPARSPARAAT